MSDIINVINEVIKDPKSLVTIRLLIQSPKLKGEQGIKNKFLLCLFSFFLKETNNLLLCEAFNSNHFVMVNAKKMANVFIWFQISVMTNK